MRFPDDPLQRAQRLAGAIALFGAIALVFLALWAFHTQEPPSIPPRPTPNIEALDASPPEPSETFDPSVFALELWKTPPPPPSTDAAAESTHPRTVEPPLRLELIGVTVRGDERIAALYDPQEDRLHLVKDGERIDRYTVQKITLDSVTLLDRHRPRVLEMKRADR